MNLYICVCIHSCHPTRKALRETDAESRPSKPATQIQQEPEDLSQLSDGQFAAQSSGTSEDETEIEEVDTEGRDLPKQFCTCGLFLF